MKRNRAVVIGGGIAGLLAAKVLSRHFGEVLLLEKDSALGTAQPRPGAPQGAHLHVLLRKGQELLRSFFPGIESELTGCPRIDWALDTLWEGPRGAFPAYPSGLTAYSFSRPFLEAKIRTRIGEIPNISFRKCHALSYSPKDHSVELLGGGRISADLLVIAGGHAFPLERFCTSVEEHTERLPIHLTYRSVFLETASLPEEGFRQYYYQPSPGDDPLGGVICPVENGKSVATIIEYGSPERGRIAYRDFLAKAAAIPGGKFFSLVKTARPLTEPATFVKAEMFLRRLHKANSIPENVFCLGDALCSMSPVFGQGMTLALLEAAELERHLRTGKACSRRFHSACAAILRLPFEISKHGSAEGGLSKRYLAAHLARSRTSRSQHRKFLEVLHMERSPLSLLSATTAMHALRGST